MKIDEILSQLKIEDLNDGLEVHSDYFVGIEFEKLKTERFYQGDGLDFYRFLIKYSDGIPIKAPRLNRMNTLVLRYIKKKIRENPAISVYYLCRDLQLDERTIRRYFRQIKKEKIISRLSHDGLF